jgi:hypothetical protein
MSAGSTEHAPTNEAARVGTYVGGNSSGIGGANNARDERSDWNNGGGGPPGKVSTMMVIRTG